MFSFVFNGLFLSRCCCARTNHAISTQSCFWKSFERKGRRAYVISSVLSTSGTCQNYIKMLFVWSTDLRWEKSIFWYGKKQWFDSAYKHSPVFNTWQVVRIYLSIRAGNSQFCVCFARKTIESRCKTNCDLETAILHYIYWRRWKKIYSPCWASDNIISRHYHAELLSQNHN